MAMGVSTYQPNKRRRVKAHGFLVRMSTKNGRLVLSAVVKKAQAPHGQRSVSTSRRDFDARLHQPERVRRRADYQRIYDRGVKVHGKFLTLFTFAKRSPDRTTRYRRDAQDRRRGDPESGETTDSRGFPP